MSDALELVSIKKAPILSIYIRCYRRIAAFQRDLKGPCAGSIFGDAEAERAVFFQASKAFPEFCGLLLVPFLTERFERSGGFPFSGMSGFFATHFNFVGRSRAKCRIPSHS